MYFMLGILLGLGIAVYFICSRDEKIEKKMAYDRKMFSTKKLDVTMENIVQRIQNKIKELKRELTEDEKNEIIIECYKEKFIYK